MNVSFSGRVIDDVWCGNNSVYGVDGNDMIVVCFGYVWDEFFDE